ncbi:MAG: 3' terminal RNA ribose 2'-O-methyltransferase Hen1 [Ardenticatenales bacterium]|nr:3' terminal RNA ribose 2'-O-methyltransferase Hen1 [Ardenticatenales bacterium]
MLLTISTTHQPATDLGYLLHKHPDRVQQFDLSFGAAHVFYPEASATRCTMALLLDVDPVRLTRRPAGAANNFALQPYVNDRPYVASSLLSVALSEVLGTALNGRCKDRPELVQQAIPLEVGLSVLPVRGGPAFLEALFAPLGYTVSAERQPLDDKFPEWGQSRYYQVQLSGTVRLADLLSHLYVLVPVLDDDKHYYVDEAEIEKLLRHGEGWLAAHPAKEEITRRYLSHFRRLTRQALAQLAEDDAVDPDATRASQDAEEEAVEQPLRLHQQRLERVVEVIRESGARRVLDLGCGEGRLLQMLAKERSIGKLLGLDVSVSSLEKAARRLRLERLSESEQKRIELIHGSLTYRDERLAGYEAAALVEVIEHLDPPRLAALERALFEFARPGLVVITTPNQEYNANFASLPAGQMRHRDHRFEWSRAELAAWAEAVAGRYGYSVRFEPIGPLDPERGAPSQMAVFTR